MEGLGPNSCTKQQVLEKKARPQEQLNCPRCNSTNTKFCYYNNYSLTQPRYFCKTCRRYWTEGGSLRNVPVGGGSRKNKKITTSTSTSSSAAVAAATASSLSKAIPDLNPPTNTTLQVSSSAVVNSSSQQNPKMQGGQDLNLAFAAMDHHNYHHHHGMTPYVEMHHNSHEHQSSSSHHAPNSLSALELLRSSMASRGLNNPYAPPNTNSSSLMQNSSNAAALYPSGFPTMQEVKPSLGFSVVDHNHHHHGINGNRTSYDHHHHHQVQDQSGGSNSGRLLFPFGDHVKQLSAGAAEVAVEQHNKEQGNSTGYWTGMIGEGSW